MNSHFLKSIGSICNLRFLASAIHRGDIPQGRCVCVRWGSVGEVFASSRSRLRTVAEGLAVTAAEDHREDRQRHKW
jgi:hypothetical protein